ncbi:MAG: hypothetical protein JWQ58_1498 [Reyranella sp.]|nr:hypothetical protein [Reyranella sp.]
MTRLLLLLVLMTAAFPAAAQVMVRTTLKPDSSVVLGQPVRVLIDVLFPGEMERPPRVTLPDTSGAQILRYESQATTLTERIDGKDRVGQRFEFALYPRRGGKLEVPAPQVVTFDRGGTETGRISGIPATLEVSVPAGVDPSKPVVAARAFTLEQNWQPDPRGAFKAGDAIVRTIVRQAPDVPGMAMLDLDFPAPPGVRVYRDPPQTNDRVDRGDLTGQRTDRVIYVFEGGGSLPLEAVVQPWWDLTSGRLRRAEGSGVTLAVTATAPAAPYAKVLLSLYVATTCLGLVFLGLWALPRLRSALSRRRALWAASETKAFHDLQHACRGDDPRAIYRAFTIWLQRIADAAEYGSFAEEIESAVFASRPWTSQKSHDFCVRLVAQRTTRRQAVSGAGLPPLNPAAR